MLEDTLRKREGSPLSSDDCNPVLKSGDPQCAGEGSRVCWKPTRNQEYGIILVFYVEERQRFYLCKKVLGESKYN